MVTSVVPMFNDTHKEKPYFTQFSTRVYRNRSLAASDIFMCLHNQLSSIYSIVPY